jgi:hypothetical protein
MTRGRIGRAAGALVLTILAFPTPAPAYSVLAHEALVDQVWDDQLAPILRQRFPRTSPDGLRRARAYAYGGSLIQDLGYYPFGNRFFSNVVHYVRSGDFVEALIRESRSVDEYAFALGALAHYASDNAGHPIAVNRVVPILYPKLREKHGPEVLYADSPARHVMVEFAFDVLQVARGAFRSDVYQDLIGFEVAAPLLERAFRATYGLALTDIFGDVDLAIGSYRHAASEIVPDITRVAWREKREEMLAANPRLTETDVVFTMTRQQYEEAFGANYRKPGVLARVVVALFKVIPKFGPFKPLAFEPLTPEAERLFLASFAASRDLYRTSLQALRAGRLRLSDSDLDTGSRATRGVNTLADETYDELVEKLIEAADAIPAELHLTINAYYASARTSPQMAAKGRKEARQAARNLAALNMRVSTADADHDARAR